tara:strand:+ start:520 stop:2967 length:2448 start_codon:yes stop_codon:yes gene_type:complete
MAKVPFQNYNLTQEVAVGSEVQFGATDVKPQQDVVSDDIKRMGKAQQSFGQVLNKIDDEINDAESKELFNNFYSDLDTIRRDYLDLKGALAVATVPSDTEGGEPKRQYDVYNGKIKDLLESYTGKASNGVVKYMFENMAQVSIKSAQSSMTTHSIKAQRDYADNERKITIGNYQNASIVDAESWKDPTSEHNKSRVAGLQLLEEQAISEGLITRGEKTSQEWLRRVSEYNMKIHEGVLNTLAKQEKWGQMDEYINSHYQAGDIDQDTANALVQSVKEKHKDYNAGEIVNHILNNNNPTDTSFSNQANLTLCLASNNHEDNDNDGICIDGFHSNELNVEDFTRDERVNILEQKRGESKFFQADSTILISEVNQPSHLFAIQTIGVEKADKFYSKALKKVEIDKDKYETDEGYKREIDGKVLNEFNKLFIKEVDKKFVSKAETLRKEIKRIESGAGSFGLIPGTDKYNKVELLKKDLAIEEGKPNYANQVIKDIKILQEGVRYKDVNPVTGLQPLSVYEKHLERTIEDPKQLAYAKEDLKLKYNQLNDQKTNQYNETYLKAQEIALSKDGGWKDLEANGIDINMFRPVDQERLKKGQPLESDKNAVIELIDNPGEIKNNLEMYRTSLNKVDYIKLKAYADSLKTDGDVATVQTDTVMLQNELNNAGFDNLYASGRSDDEKTDYIQIHDAWKNSIAEEERITGKKVGRDRKRELLKEILNTKVIYDKGVLRGDKPIIEATIDQDQFKNLYVKVGGQTIWLKSINAFQRERITSILIKNNIPVTEANIAEFWVLGGKSNVDNKEDHEAYSAETILSNMK